LEITVKQAVCRAVRLTGKEKNLKNTGDKKMKKSLFGLAVLIALASSACGVKKDAEVGAFVTETDKLAAEIVRAVDEKPSSGVDDAQRLLDSRKAALKANFEKLKDVRGFQLSKEMSKKLTDSVTKNVESVGGLQIKYVEKAAADKNFAEKLKKLASDFNSIYGV
jgi:hypothetical protein